MDNVALPHGPGPRRGARECQGGGPGAPLMASYVRSEGIGIIRGIRPNVSLTGSLCNGPVARWRGHLLIAPGSVVLRKLSTEIRECYRLAQQAREWAEQATDPRIRQDYLSVERSWLLLCLSYQYSESMTRFTENRNRNRPGHPRPAVAAKSSAKKVPVPLDL